MSRYKCGREIRENDTCYYRGVAYVVKYSNNKLSIIPCYMGNNRSLTITGYIADNLNYVSNLEKNYS